LGELFPVDEALAIGLSILAEDLLAKVDAALEPCKSKPASKGSVLPEIAVEEAITETGPAEGSAASMGVADVGERDPPTTTDGEPGGVEGAAAVVVGSATITGTKLEAEAPLAVFVRLPVTAVVVPATCTGNAIVELPVTSVVGLATTGVTADVALLSTAVGFSAVVTAAELIAAFKGTVEVIAAAVVVVTAILGIEGEAVAAAGTIKELVSNAEFDRAVSALDVTVEVLDADPASGVGSVVVEVAAPGLIGCEVGAAVEDAAP
jgi:hypothetical protein